MSQPRPLEGIRVLDLTVALSGPYGSLLLAGMGAEVIRIESPSGGDIARTNPPFVGESGIHFGAPEDGDVSLTILNRARNKKSITLDLKSAEGRAIFLDLAKQADVVMENMSEGATKRLGVTYQDVAQVNPAIIYASIKAFGEDPSVYPGLKGMDIIVQALSGIMEVTGFADGPPTRIGIPMADLIAPLYSVNGILAALIQRGRDGKGQHVQVSMLDCLASLVAEEHFDIFGKAGYPRRSGNTQDRLAPFGVYDSTDGCVAIVAFSPDWMRGLCDAMGRPDIMEDPRLNSRGPRMRHADEMNSIVQSWVGTLSSDEVVKALVSRGVPCAPVRTPDQVLHDPALIERGAVMELEHPRYGKMGAMGMGMPIHFSRSDAQFDRPALDLGASNEEIYGSILDYSPEKIAELRQRKII
ncbi:MAG: CaiB/BaiF CoA-transferase family protein [Sphingobium sp.]